MGLVLRARVLENPITPTPGNRASETVFDAALTSAFAFFFQTLLVSASELAKLSLNVSCCCSAPEEEEEYDEGLSGDDQISSPCRKRPEALESGSDRCDLEPMGRRDEDDEVSMRYCAGDDGIEK